MDPDPEHDLFSNGTIRSLEDRILRASPMPIDSALQDGRAPRASTSCILHLFWDGPSGSKASIPESVSYRASELRRRCIGHFTRDVVGRSCPVGFSAYISLFLYSVSSLWSVFHANSHLKSSHDFHLAFFNLGSVHFCGDWLCFRGVSNSDCWIWGDLSARAYRGSFDGIDEEKLRKEGSYKHLHRVVSLFLGASFLSLSLLTSRLFFLALDAQSRGQTGPIVHGPCLIQLQRC